MSKRGKVKKCRKILRFIKMFLRTTLVVFLCTVKFISGFEPLTMGFAAAGLSALGYNFETVKEYSYCVLKECCIDKYIPVNLNALRYDLTHNLYGQHIVIENVLAALKSHYKNIESSEKPLVMTFHGTAGTGKNFVSDKIAKSLYKKGLESKFVHRIFGRASFPSDADVNFYKEALVRKVIDAVSACPKSLIIIDEIDKIPAGSIDSLTSLLDHHYNVNGVNFRQAVFIFITNSGGFQISQALATEMKSGKTREELKLQNFEKICKLAAFNTAGGLKQADPIKTSLIDHYIPFLPLEERHIQQCIRKEFNRVSFPYSETDVREIVDQIIFEEQSGLFAVSGCKAITKKAEILTEVKAYQNN